MSQKCLKLESASRFSTRRRPSVIVKTLPKIRFQLYSPAPASRLLLHCRDHVVPLRCSGHCPHSDDVPHSPTDHFIWWTMCHNNHVMSHEWIHMQFIFHTVYGHGSPICSLSVFEGRLKLKMSRQHFDLAVAHVSRVVMSLTRHGDNRQCSPRVTCHVTTGPGLQCLSGVTANRKLYKITQNEAANN